MTSTKSLTVPEFADVVVKKFLQHAFSDDRNDNLNIAAEELYVLMRKVKLAAGEKSDDAKAPLKSIRNAVDQLAFAGNSGEYSAEVDSLFELYEKLEDICQDRIARNIDKEAAASVQADLRYRLTRLITGDTWENRPELKLRVLKLVFSLMVKENERLLEESRSQPSIKLASSSSLSRTLSIGRRNSKDRDVTPQRHSKWHDSIAEVGRMPGSKILPMLKVMLMENYQREAEAKALQDSNAPVTPALIDLLGGPALDLASPDTAGDEEQQSRRSSSPTPSSLAPRSDLFEALAESRRDEAHSAPFYPAPQTLAGHFRDMSISSAGQPQVQTLRPGSATGSAVSMNTGKTPTAVQTPISGHGYAPPTPGMFMTVPQPVQNFNTGMYSASPQQQMTSGGSYPGMMVQGTGGFGSNSLPRYGSGGMNLMDQGWQAPPLPDNNDKLAPASAFETNFPDVGRASPYLGVSHPFDDTRFADVSPVPSKRPPPPPPQAASMRAK